MKFGLALIVLVVGLANTARAVRIDPPSLVKLGKYFADDAVPSVILNDPRCTKGNGLISNPDDCTKYVACSNGAGQDRECPKGFKFDSVRHCTPAKDADCGRTVSPSAADIKCPKDYGYFPYQEDCHKFIVCVDGVAKLRTCPQGQVYQDNVGCVDGTECPKTYSQEESEKNTVCKKADGLVAHPNCLRYYKCVNFKPTTKNCPRGKAFDKTKESCTREQFSRCKNNDVQGIMRAA